MESSIEASQTVDMPKPKPSLGPKPRLAPKPFSLQKNTTIRSIHAPKMVTATSKTVTQQTGKSEATALPKPTSPKPAWQLTTSLLTKDQPKTTKESKESLHGEDTLDSSVGKSDPPSQMKPKSIPLQQDDIIQTNHKASTDIVTKSEQKDDKKKKDETLTSVGQKLEESGSDVSSTANQTHRQGSTRKRLSMELTSKFESGGIPLHPQPSVTTSTVAATVDAKKPESSNEEQNQTSEPSNGVSGEGVDEDYIGGGSIKRRISLLLDSSSRPEVKPKREEPEMINGIGGVKERIKNWTMETISEGPKTEKKLQHIPQPLSKSFDPVTPPTVEKTPQMPPAEPPAPETSSSQVMDLTSKFSPAKQPSESLMETSKGTSTEDESPESQRETLGESIQNKLTEGDVQLRSRSPSACHTAADEGDPAGSESTQPGLKRDNVKRRSVHFGIVERDDGGPPLILGSESDSSDEEEVEEEEGEDEAKEVNPVSVPVDKRVGIFQKDDEVHEQEAERLKHLEFEKKRRAEETEEARLKLEEERKRSEEEEREKEKARQMEVEERARERLKEEEMERQREEEWMRVRLEEDKRQEKRMKKEGLERERQLELMWQRQKEEERERAKQKEEMLKQEQEEEERLKEEERLREERERQRLREKEEEEAKLIPVNEEHRLEVKLREKDVSKVIKREEEWENAWVTKVGRLAGEEEVEREKEDEMELMWQRQNEEDRERDQQEEESLRQEEKEKERLREELEERERHQRLKEEQEKEEAMERMKQIEMEEQREEERKEEERKRQLEKNRADELERRMQEELERRRVKELQENLESVVGEAEPSLISFDSEDVCPMSESSHSPSDQTCEPVESEMEVVYEDFSVKQPLIEVEFDDFSVKPLRWGSQGKVETSPVVLCGTAEPEDEEEVDVSTWENKVPEQDENTDSFEPTLAQERKEEEVQLISFSMKVEEEESAKEEDTEEDEVKDDDRKEAQGNSCDNSEDKDTDALKDNVPEQQNEACEQTSETDSLNPVPDHDLEVSPEEVDTADFQSAEDPAPFPESSGPLLDNSAQKSKADLGKRRIRTRPSRSLRAGLSQRKSPDWRTHGSSVDETESSWKQTESDSEDEQPKHKIVCSPPPTSQRVPVFPGLSPAALIAQIKRKTGGGGEKTEEDEGREEESQNEEAAPSPSQLPCSPRSAAHLAGAARVLPPLSSMDEGAASCPAWLKELKSKKRLSQYNGEP